MSNKFPAPWTVEGYESQGGHMVWEIRDGLGFLVMAGSDKNQAESIASSRNDSEEVEGIKRITEAYQGAIDALNADLARVREQWHKEVAQTKAQIDICRDEIAALKTKNGLLI